MTTGYWDIIVPESTTNLALNPCATITGNLTAIGATGGTAVSRSTTYSYFGPACHRIQSSTDNEGGYFTLKAAANAIHYVTLRIHTASDIGFDVSMDNSNWNDMTLLATEGSWWVYGVQIVAAQANGSTALRIQQKGAGTTDLYIGHVQVEQKTYATTPVTGDLVGFYPGGYYWEGTPHGSASVRSAQERDGGKVVDIEDTYSLRVRWASGIGMPPQQHYVQAQPLLPGMAFTGAKILPRMIDLTAIVGTSKTPATIHSTRKTIINALKLELVATPQPVKLRYRGALSTKPVEFRAVYDTGMEFDMAGQAYEQVALRLICYDPFAYEVHDASASLTTTLSVSNADYCMKRISGTWSNISTKFNGAVKCMAKAANGNIYIGGTWAADVSDASDGNGIGIIEYNPTTGALTSIGTGLDGNKDVLAMAVLPNGDLIIGGDFTNAGGVANADYIAKWDVSVPEWVALSATLLNNVVRALTVGTDGTVFAGGDFTNVAGGATDYVVRYTTAGAWAAAGDGFDGAVRALLTAPNGYVYATGAFANSGGVGIDEQVAVWNGTAWAAVGSGAMSGGSDYGMSLAIAKNGYLYLGGSFTAVGGATASGFAVYNGNSWAAVSSTTFTNYMTSSLAFDKNGLLYLGIGGLATPGGFFGGTNDYCITWNGYTYSLLDNDLTNAAAGVEAILPDGDNLFIGFDGSGTATTSYLNTVTNGGTSRAYPIIHIKRAGGTSANVLQIRNETTGKIVYMDYDLQDGEELILDFRLGRRKVYSSFYGDVWRAILRGSDFSDFYLQSGTNYISSQVYTAGSPTITAYAEWRTTHLSADGVAA